MDLKVKTGFRDKEARLDRFTGQEFSTTAERGAHLVELGLAEEVKAEDEEVKAEDKKEDSGAAGRATKEEKKARKTK